MKRKPRPVMQSDRQPRSLARRVTGWTSNLLATGIVLTMAVGLGRQLVQWWRVDSSAPHGEAAAGLTPQDSQSPARLEFGDRGYALQREHFSGDQQSALARLQQQCRTVVKAGGPPQQEQGASEKRFLKLAANRTPIEQQPGQWEIHRFDGDFPLLVAIREGEAPAEPEREARQEPRPPGKPLAGPLRRVLAWGLAVPVNEEAWTLYLYRASGSSQGVPLASPQVPLPEGSRRTLSLVGQRGEATIGISGSGAAKDWMRDFDRGFQHLGLKARGWHIAGGAWHVRYEHKTPSAGYVEVKFREEPAGRLVGLVLAFPAAESSERGNP